MSVTRLGGTSRGPSWTTSLALAALLVAGSCDSSSRAPAEPTPRARARAEKSFEPLPRAKPPALESGLTLQNIRGCLYRERLDPSDYAGVYYGPVDLVSDQVETSRSLDFGVPDVELLEPREFDDAVVGNRVTIPVDEEVTTKMLAWALGITPQGFDVNFFLSGNDSGLIAGFYDPRHEDIVIEQKGKLDREYVVMAHEFTHAAADQAFGLPKKKIEPIVDDVSLGKSSLVEGDAVLSELRFLSRLSPPKAVRKAVSAQIGFTQKFLEDRRSKVPYLLIDTALFPYQWGLAFACTLFKKGGWRAINRAYSNPPTTSAQILFPERFLRRERPLESPPVDKPGPLWQLRDQGHIGAAHLKAMFEAPGDNETQSLNRSLSRAASWAGGYYKVWTVGTTEREYAVGLSLVEHEDYEGLLCSSMNRWYRTAFGDAEQELVADGTVHLEGTQQDAVLACRGRDVTMAFAPSLELAAAVLRTGEF